MPNIEIHGAKPHEADGLLEIIKSQFGSTKYKKDVVVSVVSDIVNDLDGRPRPFFRIIFAKNEPTGVFDDCINRLSVLNMDTEIVVIREFILKKK